MASIANIIVSMIADTGKFDTDIKRSSKQAAAEMKKMEREMEKIGRTIGVAFAAVAGASALVVAKTINAADNIRDLSIKTGIGTEALSQYASIAAKSGTTLETFAGSVNKMQRSLVAASEGGQAQSEAFQKLGLSVSELLKLQPDKQFEAIAEKLSGMGDAAQRAAIGQAVFGRGFAAIAPLVAEGAKGIEEARDKAERFGITIGQEFADNADRFNDNMRDMRDIGQGVANQFTSGLLPSLISLQEGFIGMDRDISVAQKTGESFGLSIQQLVAAFIVLKAVATAVGVTIVSTLVTAAGGVAALISPLTGLLVTLTDVGRKFAEGDFAGGAAELSNTMANIKTAFDEGAEAIKSAGGATAEAWGPELQAEIKRAFDIMNAVPPVMEKTAKAANGVTGAITKTAKATTEWANRQKIASKSIADNLKFLEELEEEQVRYNETLQDFIDIGDPVGAMVREFSLQLEFANTALANGDITLEQYQASLNELSDGLGKAAAGMKDVAKESDVANEAMLEGVRILERTFTDLWSSILDGSLNVWEGMLDGFKTMLAQMLHQLLTAPLIKELERVFSQDGGGLADLDFSKLATGIAGAVGVGLGSLLGGGGQFAGIGSGIGSLIGQSAFKALFTSLGAAAGPIGIVIGGLLGGLLGGLFDKKKTPTLQASGFNNFGAKGDNVSLESIFGKTFLHGRHTDDAAIEQFKKSILEFDSAIGSFLNDDQIGAVSEALTKWNTSMKGDAISLEALLGSRFETILSTFSDTIKTFVEDAVSLEEKVARLQVGVGAEKIFAELPDVFAGRTINEFLAVVEAFQDGTESITDAFKEVLVLLDIITNVKTSLQDFADSDLGADFASLLQLQSESVVETLTRLTSGLDDAIRNFDGSPEQLVQIGNLALSIRQQELVALSLIDSIAKGLASNLAKLREDVTATINGPRAAEDVLFDARALITAVSQAQTPEEIAQIGQQFDALIRSLSPEDTKRFATSTLAIIDSFTAASAAALESQKQAILDSGQAVRDMVDGFAQMIDPLKIIADSNERAALALEAIATGQAVVVTSPVAPDESTGNSDDLATVMTEGATQMSNALTDGVSFMSSQLANAIRVGFAGANVQVNVVVQGTNSGFVTQ